MRVAASAALTPCAAPPTAPTTAPILMDVLWKAIFCELQIGHRNDMVEASMMNIQCRDIGM